MNIITSQPSLNHLPDEIATIFDKFDRTKPILEYKPVPNFKTRAEKDKFWDREYNRFREGYNGIPGTLYFKTMYCGMVNDMTGEIKRPVCRDADLYMHTKLNMARMSNRSFGVMKGKGYGFSTDLGSLAIYFQLLYPGTRQLLTSKDQGAISSLFTYKVMSVYDRLHPDLKPIERTRNQTKSKSGITFLNEYLDEYGRKVETIGEILARETSSSDVSASAFAGNRAIFAGVDELPLHLRKIKLLNALQTCLINPLTKLLEGLLVWGGTLEDSISNEDVLEFKALIEDAETWKSDIVFMDCVWGMQRPEVAKKYGVLAWTDWDYGTEWWNKEYERVSAASDSSVKRSFLKIYPRKPEHVFEITSGLYWEDDVSEIVKEQFDYVTKNPPLIQTGRVLRNGNKVDFIPSKEGYLEVLERPRDGVTYFLGIDGVGSDDRTSVTNKKERSLIAATVIKGYQAAGERNFVPVCQYAEAAEKIEQCYERILSMALWYGAFTHPESNVGQATAIVSYFINAGYERLLFPLQLIVGSHKLKKRNVYGQYRTMEVLAKQIEFGNMYLRKYGNQIEIPSLLKEIHIAVKNKNFDRLSSFLTALSIAWPKISKPIQDETKLLRNIEHIEWVEVNGILTARKVVH